MLRIAGLLISMVVLSACVGAGDLDQLPVPLGNFNLGHNVVVAPKVATASAVSRELDKEVLTASLKEAIGKRFDRYEGSKDYHFGVSIEGYVLARAGIPVIASPKSAMIIRLTVWDDAQGVKLNTSPEQITILEELNGASVVGTGWSQSAETQLANLSANAAKAIENYLVKQNDAEGWFNDAPDGSQKDATATQSNLESTDLIAQAAE